MSPIESLPVGIDGLALAWESVAALLGALGLGLAAGVLVGARRSRRPPRPIAAERERELESLRRIAAELAQTSDVEGVARALLDEIAALFRVGFVTLSGLHQGADLFAGGVAFLVYFIGLAYDPATFAVNFRKTVEDIVGKAPVPERFTNRFQIFSQIGQVDHYLRFCP